MSLNLSPHDVIESLWADAIQAESKHPTRPATKNARAETPKLIHSSELYTLPENWRRGRGIALMHEETATLLGTFVEYTHKSVPNCRRLCREDGPVAVDATEYVSGPQWVFIAKEIPSPTVATRTQDILLPELILREIGVAADLVELTVFFIYSGIMRAELKEHTTFHSPDNRTIITFPAGTNVYACMDVDAKIAVRKEVSQS